MGNNFILIIFILIFTSGFAYAEEVKFILHDKCINELYVPASAYFMYDEIYVIRDSRGIILRFKLEEPEAELKALSERMLKNINRVESFLAKIKNLVIIEVHVGELSSGELKKWEISAVIAGKLEQAVCDSDTALKERIYSVGYGEFLPAKNTPNNGGNFLNRVDIIILCNISGE